MAGDHLALEEGIGSHLAQARDPLGGLDVQHACVVEGRHREDAGIGRVGAHVLVRGIPLHVRVDAGVMEGISPLVPLDDGEGERGVEDGGERVHERDVREDPREQLGCEVGDGAHQQAAGRAALGDEGRRGRVPLGDEVARTVDEVREGVALGEELAVLVPLPAHLAAAAHVRHREDHAAVELGQPRDREPGLDGVLVGAVPVEVHGPGGTARLAERALPDERDGDRRAVGGPRPHPRLPVVARVVSAEDGLLLAQQEVAARDLVVVHRPGCRERGIADADDRRRPFRVARRPDRVQRFVELQLPHVAVRVIEDAQPREPAAPVAQDSPVAEGGQPQEPDPRPVRDHDPALAGGIGGRDLDELEVEGVIVVQDEQHVGAVDDGVVAVVLDALPPRPHHARLGAEVVGVDEPFLGGDGRADPDDEVAVAAGEAGSHPVALVRLVEQRGVGGHVGPELVEPHGVGSPRVIHRRVDDVPAVGGEGRARARTGDLVGKVLAGPQIAHPQRVALVAGDVDPVEHQRAVVGDLEAAEREELVPFGFHIPVEQHLLPGDLGLGRQDRRRPVIGRGERSPALDAVLLALDRPAVVPPFAAPTRHREVGLLRPALDLLEDPFPQSLQVRGACLGVRVLGLQVRDDGGVVLVAHPFVRVVERVAVVRTGGGTALRGGWDEGCRVGGGSVGHASTLVARMRAAPV